MRVTGIAGLLCLVAAASAARAESRFGPVFGMGASRASGHLHSVFDGALIAPTIGASFRQPLGAGWAFRTGIEKAKRGATRTGPLLVVSIPSWGITDSLGSVSWTWYGWWMDVPMLAEKRWGDGRVRPFVLAGPEMSWRTSGSNPSGNDGRDVDHSRGASVAALAGIGIAIRDHGSVLSVEAVARVALADAFKDGPSGRLHDASLRLVLQP